MADNHLVNSLEKENCQFKKILAIQKRIGSERQLDRLMPLIISEISELLDAERTTIFLIDWERMELQAKFAEGIVEQEITIKLKMGIVGWAVLSKQEISISNASDHPYFNPEIDQLHDFKTESILVAPIINKQGEVLGALELINKDTGVFTEHDLEMTRQDAAKLGLEDNLQNIAAGRIEQMIDCLVRNASCQRGSLFLIDADSGQLMSVFAHGLDGSAISLSLNLGVAGLVAVSGKVINILDSATDSRFDQKIDQLTGFETKTILGLPIRNYLDEVIGVIEIINKCNDSFSGEDIEIMDGLSSMVAITMDNALMLAEQERQFRSIIEVMAASIDAKDTLTAGHSTQVTHYAVEIARELGFGESDLDVIGVAGLLHDYGKLGIDDQILKKPGRLSDREYSQIKEHVTLTRSILGKMRFARKYRNVPIIAAAHHELLDGSGYDSGILGREIPFMAKIITVADVFEALTSKRHYRQAMPKDEALALIEKDSGCKYDAKVIKALKNYLAKLQVNSQ
ncbi:MAG: GAF domain-containing protein [Proteobacteria bacterium]|nr:GAF domain-containing protein [Pseudomonadota bacterium]MBU1716709.1 GAF domain-containing protein [Pseudomonadota bacterium]